MFKKLLLALLITTNAFALGTPPGPTSPIIWGPGCAFNLITGACISGSGAGVLSFNGRQGTVVPLTGDYNTSQVPEGSNLYFTSARFNSSFAGETTSNLAEGTNLYYTQARFDSAFSAKSTSDLSEGSNKYYTNQRVLDVLATQYQIANGIAQLDVNGKVLTSELPSSVVNGLHFVGTWDASTNAPTLSNGGGGGVAGDYYIVSVAGTTSIDGNSSWAVGDSIIDGGSLWYKVGQTQNVVSVNGATGIVVLNSDNIAEGSTNLYYTNARARSALSGTSPITYNSSTGAIGINTASTSVAGALTNTDWNTFNSKQSALTFGSIATSTTGVTVGSGANSTVGPSVTVNVQTANTTQPGLLSSTDWNTFNGKQNALTVGTSLQYVRGDLTNQTLNTSAVPESSNLYYTNARGIGSTLTGYTSGAGTISAADSVLGAIQKLNGNIAGLVSGVSSVFGRTGAVTATTGDYLSSQVTESGNLYFTNGRAQAAISASSPLTYTSGSVGCQTASGSQAGCVSSSDWTAFNGKQDALGFTPVNKAGDQMTGQFGEAVSTLTYGTTIAVNAALGNVFDVTLTGASATLSNPTGAYDGQKLTFRIHQDATGSRNLILGSNYKFGTGLTSITLSTAANATDILGVVYYSAIGKYLVVAFAGGF